MHASDYLSDLQLCQHHVRPYNMESTTAAQAILATPLTIPPSDRAGLRPDPVDHNRVHNECRE